MKKKHSKNLIILLTLLLFTGCSNKNSVTRLNNTIGNSNKISNINDRDTSNSTKTTKNTNSNSHIYNVTGKKYFYNKNNKRIELKYPQVNNFNNLTLQKQINELIKKKSLEPLKSYINNNENFTITLGYNIHFNNKNLFSITYKGLFSSKNTAYPTNLFQTITIDMLHGKVLTLKDIIDVNQSFLKVLKMKGIIVNTSLPKELIKAQKIELQDYTINDLANSKLFFYLTNNSIVISIQVPHAIGDHLEVEIAYKYISKNINVHTNIWQNFYKSLKK